MWIRNIGIEWRMLIIYIGIEWRMAEPRVLVARVILHLVSTKGGKEGRNGTRTRTRVGRQDRTGTESRRGRRWTKRDEDRERER
jgi:hypothetical protein